MHPNVPFDRALIPLCGSEGSEHGLQLARALRPGGAGATLLQVVTGEGGASEATRYLKGARPRLGQRARVLVQRAADPAAQILAEVALGGYSLVVLTTRGRRGVRRLLREGVAQRVHRGCGVPVLIQGPKGRSPSPPGIRRVLIPLEGGEAPAEVLSRVEQVCRPLGAMAVLFAAVRIAPHENALAYAREIDDASRAARATLRTHATALEQTGVQAAVHVGVGSPAAAILRTADEQGVDLIAMPTRARGALRRWLFGSVAEAVLAGSPRPILLLPAARPAVPAGRSEASRERSLR